MRSGMRVMDLSERKMGGELCKIDTERSEKKYLFSLMAGNTNAVPESERSRPGWPKREQ